MPLTTRASPAWHQTWGKWRWRSGSGSGPKDGETCSTRTTDSCNRGTALLAEGFDPTEVTFEYTEANGWQYNFFVPA